MSDFRDGEVVFVGVIPADDGTVHYVGHTDELGWHMRANHDECVNWFATQGQAFSVLARICTPEMFKHSMVVALHLTKRPATVEGATGSDIGAWLKARAATRSAR